MHLFKDLTSSQTKMLLYLILKSGGTNSSISISLNQLESELNLTHTTIIKTLRQLSNLRLIEILNGQEQGNHVSNTYIFLFDKQEMLRNSLL